MARGQFVSPASERSRICRAMLKHVAHPAHLRVNPLVAELAASAGISVTSCSDEALCAFVESAIEQVVLVLPPRQQTIVRRCDIGGERYADVARTLYVSERHAFRERDAAIETILKHLPAVLPARNAVSARAPTDIVEAYLAQARALEHNGHWKTAAVLLEELSATVADAGTRSSIETRLVRLYVDAGRFIEGERHVTIARSLLANLEDGAWQQAEVDVASARLAEAIGAVDEAADLARRSCRVLQAELGRRHSARILDALIDALVLRATIAIGHGQFDEAIGIASSALELCGRERDVDPLVAIGARSIAAMTMLFGGRDIAFAERELLACYRLAAGAGLTRESLVVATHLAGLYRLSKRPKLSLALLTPLATAARLMGPGECAAGVFNEIASAALEAESHDTAATYLADVHAFALGHTSMQPQAELLMSRVHLASGNFAAALGFARNAEAGFARIGKERLAGTALRLQAEALAGLGQTERAIDTATRSVETLRGRSHPERLAAAYRVLGKLSGDPSHLLKARRIARSGNPEKRH